MEGIPPKKDPKDPKELLGAESAEQIWADFWEGENGLKHSGWIGGVDIDEVDEYGFVDYENLDVDLGLVNEQTLEIRDGLKAFLEGLRDKGGVGVANYVDELGIRVTDDEDNDVGDVWMRGATALSTTEVDELWNGEEGRDALERGLKNVRRNFLKSFTLAAIMEGCNSFEECKTCYDQWKDIDEFEVFVSAPVFTAWLSRAVGWDQKREVLMEFEYFGLPYGDEFIEAFFDGAETLEDQKVLVRQLLDDEEISEGYKNAGFFYAWLRREKTAAGKGEIFMIQTGEYKLKFSNFNVLGMLLNLDSFNEFKKVFAYLQTNSDTAKMIRDRGFLLTLMHKDNFTLGQKIKIIDLYKKIDIEVDDECMRAIWEPMNDLTTFRKSFGRMAEVYRLEMKGVFPAEFIKKYLSLSSADGIESLKEACVNIKKSGAVITEEIVKGMSFSDGYAAVILDDSDFDKHPVVRLYAVMKVIGEVWKNGDYPGPRILETVEALPKYEKEILKGKMERFFNKNDVDIEDEYIHYCLGDEIEYDVYPASDDMEPILERDFDPWLELYGKVCQRNLDFYSKGVDVAIKENKVFDRNAMGMFKGMPQKLIPKLRAAISELVDAEQAKADGLRSEDAGVEALDRYLGRMAQKKKAKGKKRKGRRR